MVEIIFFSCLIVVSLLFVFLTSKKSDEKNHPPGPKSDPIFGSLFSLGPGEDYKDFTKLSKKYGPIYRLKLGSMFLVVLSDPKLIRTTFKREEFSMRAPSYVYQTIMNGCGIVNSGGEFEKEQKKFVSTTFENLREIKCGVIKAAIEKTIKELLSKVIQNLKNAPANKNGVDPSPILYNCLGKILSKLIFGVTYEEDDKTWKWLSDLNKKREKYFIYASALDVFPFMKYLPGYTFSLKSLINIKLKTHEYYRKLLDQHESNIKNDNYRSDSILAAFYAEMTKRKINDNVESFSEQQCCHLLGELFESGLESILPAVRWILLYLAMMPEQQEKIHQEIKSVLGDNQDITLEEKSSLILLQAFICEVQRIRPVTALGFNRGAAKETTINGYVIPQGATILPLHWAIHMNPTYWENPKEFNPKRFISSEGKLVEPPEFIPFESGSRISVTDELAKMIIFLIVGKIVKELKISVPNNQYVSLKGSRKRFLVPRDYKLIFVPRR